MTEAGVVIVGGGQGGYQLACSLREAGYTESVHLLAAETHLPYQRPPLSKAYLAGQLGTDKVHLRGRDFYAKRDISLRLNDPVTHISRTDRRVTLQSGITLPYQRLALATGASALGLAVPGAEHPDVLTLRGIHDADRLRAALSRPRRIIVVGGGFVGLEFAAVAVMAGHRVTVVEGLSRLLSRALSPEIADSLHRLHRQAGVTTVFNRVVAEVHHLGAAISGVELDDGTMIGADLVVVGIGARPDTALAAAAGLTVNDGVVVDATLTTSDPHISALGDCARYPSVHADADVRLESVQNAVDQARYLAKRLTGAAVDHYSSVPWFWTHQYGAKVQMAGLADAGDTPVTLGDPTGDAYSVLRFRAGRLTCVESLNRPADHMAARRILAGDARPVIEDITDRFDLKAFDQAHPVQV
jgi:3-phenylpropionate/trans-cinnamate dioxygenase ferredoxin reductase subunit